MQISHTNFKIEKHPVTSDIGYYQQQYYADQQNLIFEAEIVFKQQVFEEGTTQIQASKNGVQQMMKYEKPKWNAIFQQSLHRCCTLGLIFEVVIDFIPASQVLIKKESKHVLDHWAYGEPRLWRMRLSNARAKQSRRTP